MEGNRSVYDTNCSCNKHTEGCVCFSSSKEMNEVEALQEPFLVAEMLNCPCDDPVIADRINYAILKFISSKFRSKRWLKMIFGKKIACAMHGANISTRVSLICNPNNHDLPTNINPRRS
jgi:hypothetical protein